MLRRTLTIIGMTALMAVMTVIPIRAEINREDDGNNQDRYDQIKIDRYLDVEVWTDKADGEYFEGDNIVIYYRANRDAYVAIYSVDSRNRVNLLYPTDPTEDNFVEGGVTYQLPGPYHDFDLAVSGPEGVENIQVIASKERFPIPDWFPNSGLVCDWDDRFEFMDFVNTRHFVRYPGQRFAYDRTSIYINEWEETYFRPVYYPHYPSWTVTGNVYIDYPYGGTVYINGIYWGVAPLYIPRIYVGWHTVTIYDRWGYCWENDIHIGHYNTIVLNNTIIRPRPNFHSKYKEVRTVGYRDPVKHGYPKYASKTVVVNGKKTTISKIATTNKKGTEIIYDMPTTKKYVKGTTSVVKTDRGYETAGKKVTKTTYESKSGSATKSTTSYKGTKRSSGSKSGTTYQPSTSDKKSSSSGYYQKKSGSSIKSGKTTTSKKSSGSAKKYESKSSKKSGSSKSTAPSKSSGSVKKQSSSDSKAKSSGSSGSSKKSGGGSKSDGSKSKSSGSKSKTKR